MLFLELFRCSVIVYDQTFAVDLFFPILYDFYRLPVLQNDLDKRESG